MPETRIVKRRESESRNVSIRFPVETLDRDLDAFVRDEQQGMLDDGYIVRETHAVREQLTDEVVVTMVFERITTATEGDDADE